MPLAPILTIGHSNRTADALVALLQAAGSDLVVDVRSIPRSGRHPQFNIEALPPVLVAAGIGYRHLPALGGRRPALVAAARSPNMGWGEGGFRTYADHALGPEFRAGLDALLALAATRRPTIMCAEAAWEHCHRRIIADYLLLRGVSVQHIVGPGRTMPAERTAFAIPRADGTLRYPPRQGSLL